jgi:hypothetical protein
MTKRRSFNLTPLLKEKMRFEVPETSAILNYLYGDVSSREIEAAVYWEYCRLNAEVVRIARVCQQAVRSGSGDPVAQTMIDVSSDQFMDWPWGAIWQSPSFPIAPWIDLTAQEKDEIILFIINREAIRPLPTWDVRILNGLGVFDFLKELAANAQKAAIKKRIPARSPAGQGEHIVFTINYREGLDRTKKQFAKWLREHEQRKRFVDYQKRRRGRDKGRKKLIDMLRTLAIRRLHECAKGHAASVANWLIVNQREDKKYPEQRKSGYTEREIRKAVKRSRCYETELFSKTGMEL